MTVIPSKRLTPEEIHHCGENVESAIRREGSELDDPDISFEVPGRPGILLSLLTYQGDST